MGHACKWPRRRLTLAELPGKTKDAERTGGGVYPEVGLGIGTGEGLERWGYWKTGEGIDND